MKIFICLFLFLILTQNVLAQKIEFEYPAETNSQNITFKLTLLDFPKDSYDVKIDLFNEEKRISKIFNGGWKSTMYYLNEAISPEETKIFLLTVDNFIGDADIIVKLRDSKEKVYTFDNYSMKIVQNLEKEINDEKEESSEEESASKEKKEGRKDIDFLSEAFNPEPIEYEPLFLNPKTIKTNENSKEEKKDYTKYLFFIFCLILFLLYAIKPRKRKNEFGK